MASGSDSGPLLKEQHVEMSASGKICGVAIRASYIDRYQYVIYIDERQYVTWFYIDACQYLRKVA